MNPDGSDRAPTGQPGPPDPMLGQVLDGRYQIQRKLGEGGMGEVYAAQHVRLGKLVAIKLLRHEIVSNVEAVRRFEQEAKSASSIGHKNIIGILDSGELPDGRIYLSMELLAGKPLNELLKEPLPPDRVLNILIQTGHGLAAAHKKGIVHRDMKPENIFVTLTEEGEEIPKLLDFGIAKMAAGEGNNHLTKTGTIFGTPFYMAPEQALGQNVDPRADIYAMGVIMYEVFTGSVPFAGESFMAILTQHITAEPRPPGQLAAERGRVIPPGIEPIIVKAMKKEADQRFQSMDELVAALVTIYRGIAGAGMSSYMQAMPVQPSAVHAAAPSPTPMPAPYGGPVASQPSATPAPYVGGPASTPYANQGSSIPPYADGSATFDAPPRSRTGLIVGVVVVLLAGAAAAAFFLVQDKGQGQPVARANAGGSAAKPAVTSPSDPTPTPSNGDGSGAITPPDPRPTTAIDAGAAVTPPTPIDAAPAVTPTPDPTPTVAPVMVMVNSEPQGADVFRDGKKLPGKTPMLVEVTPGEPFAVVLRRKRYRDHSLTLDATRKKVSPRLEKLRDDAPGHPTSPEPRPDPGPEPEPPDPDPVKPDPTPEDPCKLNPEAPSCQLE